MEGLTPHNPVAQIANVHTVFNIVTTLLLLPFGNFMAKAAQKILPDGKEPKEEKMELKFIRPFESSYIVGHGALVLTQIEQEVERMRAMVLHTVAGSFDAVIKSDLSEKKALLEKEEYVDYLNAEISRYIVSVMPSEMAVQDSVKLTGFYKILSNLERVSDHAMNILGYAEDIVVRQADFSEEARQEISDMKSVCLEILDAITIQGWPDAKNVLERTAKREQKIDDMREKYQRQQMKRMIKGTCKADASILYSEMLTDFERIGDHALNVAEQYYEMV